MKWTSLTFSVLMLTLSACKDKGGTDSGSALVGDATAGATVYANVCASCHGANGEGTEGYAPSMTEEVPDLSDEEITDVVNNGYEAMPAQSLTEQEMADLLAYLNETFGP